MRFHLLNIHKVFCSLQTGKSLALVYTPPDVNQMIYPDKHLSVYIICELKSLWECLVCGRHHCATMREKLIPMRQISGLSYLLETIIR